MAAWRCGSTARDNTGQAGVVQALQLAQLAATRRAANAAGNIDARTLVIAPGRGRVPPPPGSGTSSAGPGTATSGRRAQVVGHGSSRPLRGRGDRPGPSSRRPGRWGRPVADAALLLASGGTGTVAHMACGPWAARPLPAWLKSALQGRLGVCPEPLDGSPAPGPIVQGRVVETRRP